MNRYTGCVFRLSVVPHQLSSDNRSNCFFGSYFLLLAISAGLVSSFVARASSLDCNEPRVPSHELRFRFQPGDKFSLVSVNERKTVRYVDADEESTEQTVRLRCDLDVEQVELDGCAWAKYTYRQVALKVRGRDKDIDYDSDESQSRTAFGDTSPIGGTTATQSPLQRPGRNAAVPPQVLPWVTAIDEGFYLRITPQGRITNINGLAAVVGNAKSKVPPAAVLYQQGATGSMRGQFIEAIEQQFTEGRIKRLLEGQLAVFPDVNAGPVNIGDTWRRGQWTDEDRLSLEWIYRFKERRDRIAVVDVNLIVGSDANAALIFIEGMKAERKISGQGAGQIEIEQLSGRIINSTLTYDVVEKITFLPQGAMRRPPPAPAPARSHTVITFQMIKRDSDPASPSARAEAGKPTDPAAPQGRDAEANQPAPSNPW